MTSSSNPLAKATGPLYPQGGATYTYSSTAGNPVISTISGSDAYGSIGALCSSAPVKMQYSVEGGEPRISFFEHDGQSKVKAVFEPDTGMSVTEFSRVMTLVLVLRENGTNPTFEPISYIRRHNLERHFRFSTA